MARTRYFKPTSGRKETAKRFGTFRELTEYLKRLPAPPDDGDVGGGWSDGMGRFQPKGTRPFRELSDYLMRRGGAEPRP